MERDIRLINDIIIDLRFEECGFPVDQDQTNHKLDVLDKGLGSLKADQKTRMLNNSKYNQALQKLRDELQSLLKLTKDKARKNQLVKIRDQILGSKLKGAFENETAQRQASVVFKEFIKGITYFSNETEYNDKEMIYHRNGSCTKNGAGNVNCSAFNNSAHKKSKKHLIEKCFIERLIYDQLWQQIQQVPQDIKHLEWLHNTRLAYLSCFPDFEIKIDIEKYEIMPEKLKISRYFKGNHIDSEIYIKRYSNIYEDVVYCIKNNHVLKRKYAKEQTFQQQGKWKNVNPIKMDQGEILFRKWIKESRQPIS